MRFDKFTTVAQEAISAAQSAANGAGHPEITPLHLLTALLAEKTSATASLLQKAGVDPARVREVAEAEMRRLPRVQGGSANSASRELGGTSDAPLPPAPPPSCEVCRAGVDMQENCEGFFDFLLSPRLKKQGGKKKGK